MASHLVHVARAAGLGVVAGSRSGAAPTALLWAWNSRRPNRFTSIATPLSVVYAAVETVGDKLPQTPSRLQPPGIVARLVAGAATAGALTLTGRRPAALILAAAIGAGGAYAGSRVGAAWRTVAAKTFGRDLPGALLEDAAAWAVAILLVRNAVRPRQPVR